MKSPFIVLILVAGYALAALELVDPTPDAFPLVSDGNAAPIVLPADAPEVVRIAAEDLAEDIGAVTGIKPQVTDRKSGTPAVVLRLTDIDRWETFRLSAEADTLTIDGSDPRGLAFGIYDLSRRIGVSPWHWWADVPAKKRDTLHLAAGTGPVESPAVRYRGIFINDEDWGLHPWAAKTFEPKVGDIGPETYARIFELLLRLRANTIWPAMHECTKPFFQIPGNNEAADDYAIVIGSSHAEPMLRNNVGEWKGDKSHYNYLTHQKKVLGYWEDRVKQRASGESLFTLGMRGIHDSPIMGPKNQKQRIGTLEDIFTEQRKMLSEHLGDLSRTGQIFCPYKEVLDDYNAGLEVPDDVALVWPDDNFGYIRHFPTAAERKRSGGSGVYYHLSYLGAPMAWLWFDSLPPALVWSEMNRAYAFGARDFWIANVGDLKGNELSTAWFLDLAWHADTYGPDSGADFLNRFAAENFGPDHAATVAGLWQRHQALAFTRKPEHLQWHLPLSEYQPTELTDDEITDRLADYAKLAAETKTLVASLDPPLHDAAFQLITYPVLCADAANRRYFHTELARRGHPAADLDAATAADREINDLTRRYNEDVAGGKWRHIMSAAGLSARAWPRFKPARFPELLKGAKAPGTSAEKAAAPSVSDAPDLQGPGFFEQNGVVSIHAGHFTDRQDVDGGGWQAVPGLGRTGSAVTLVPADLKGAPELAYRFHVAKGGPAEVHVRLLPTHPVDGNERRIGVAIDRGSPLVLTGKDPKPKSKEWNDEVLSNATTLRAKLPGTLKPGWHTLRLVAVDPGITVDKIVLDLGGLKPSYDAPPETRIGE
jgi:hypothetical protein